MFNFVLSLAFNLPFTIIVFIPIFLLTRKKLEQKYHWFILFIMWFVMAFVNPHNQVVTNNSGAQNTVTQPTKTANEVNSKASNQPIVAQSNSDATSNPNSILVEISKAALSDLKNAATEVYAQNIPDSLVGYKTSQNVVLLNYAKRLYFHNNQQLIGFELQSFHKTAGVGYKCICEPSCVYYIMHPGNTNWVQLK